ncbi:hypothetical protein TURU_168713 [Turdus rufiventris]|nr:hypothetical protein TURU_168713 [Turdus rufiventris]
MEQQVEKLHRAEMKKQNRVSSPQGEFLPFDITVSRTKDGKDGKPASGSLAAEDLCHAEAVRSERSCRLRQFYEDVCHIRRTFELCVKIPPCPSRSRDLIDMVQGQQLCLYSSSGKRLNHPIRLWQFYILAVNLWQQVWKDDWGYDDMEVTLGCFSHHPAPGGGFRNSETANLGTA